MSINNIEYLNKNKWFSQKIHQKNNRIQHASKHYGKSAIISKRKHPLKQRKDIKKFFNQRNRKKIYKQMAFDFDDFLYKNKYENYKRIQIRPSIQYNNNYTTIKSMYNSYYCPSNVEYPTINTQNHKKYVNHNTSNVDSVSVNIKYYAIPKDGVTIGNDSNSNKLEWNCPKCTLINNISSKECELCFALRHAKYETDINNFKFFSNKKYDILDSAVTTTKIYGNDGNIKDIKTENQRISLTNAFYNNYTSGKRSFSHIEKNLTLEIADKSLKSYKGNITNYSILNEFKGISATKLSRNWDINYFYPNKKNNICKQKDNIDLKYVLYDIIPSIWMTYDIIFEYIGYKSLNVFLSANANINNLRSMRIIDNNDNVPNLIKKSIKNSNHGISYYKGSLYKRMRKYNDYSKDIISYIPSYIYYKQKINLNENNKYYNIAEYNKIDWYIMSSLCNLKKKKKRYRSIAKQKKLTNPIIIKEKEDKIPNDPIICWCGCKEKIKGRHVGKTFNSLKRMKMCFATWNSKQESRIFRGSRGSKSSNPGLYIF